MTLLKYIFTGLVTVPIFGVGMLLYFKFSAEIMPKRKSSSGSRSSRTDQQADPKKKSGRRGRK